jgi:hypothetical protein
MASPSTRIAAALGVASVELATLAGGNVGEVYRVRLADGRSLVAKLGPPNGALARWSSPGLMDTL